MRVDEYDGEEEDGCDKLEQVRLSAGVAERLEFHRPSQQPRLALVVPSLRIWLVGQVSMTRSRCSAVGGLIGAGNSVSWQGFTASEGGEGGGDEEVGGARPTLAGGYGARAPESLSAVAGDERGVGAEEVADVAGEIGSLVGLRTTETIVPSSSRQHRSVCQRRNRLARF